MLTTYLPIAISLAALIYTIYNSSTKDTKDNTTELTTVIVKLENIGVGITDIKAEIAALRNDQKDDHDRLIKVESSLSTAWKRIDELRKNADL